MPRPRPNYSYEGDLAERQPLDASQYPSPHALHQPYRDQYELPPPHDPPPYYHHASTPSTLSQTAPAAKRTPAAAHPDSSYYYNQRLRDTRRHRRDADFSDPISAPKPPPHRRDQDAAGRYRQRGRPPSNVTPGVDNFADTAAGGMAGIAYSVAERNARESGLDPSQPPPPAPNFPQQAYHQNQQGAAWPDDHASPHASPEGDSHSSPSRRSWTAANPPGLAAEARHSRSSVAGLGPSAYPPGHSTPGARTPSRSPHSFNNDVYTDDPYQNYPRSQDMHLGVVNPNDIEDDGDDGLEYGRRAPRASMLSLGGSSRGARDGSSTPNGTGGAAAAGGVMGAIGGLVGRSGNNQYDPVGGSAANRSIGNGGGGGAGGPGGRAGSGSGGSSNGADMAAYDLGGGGSGPAGEKSAWLAEQKKGNKKWKIAVLLVVAAAIIAGIVCGVVFGVVLKKNDSSSSGSAADDDSHGDLGIDSPEIKKLLNNPDLHKVFPGMDYTPLNSQYPDCTKNPPSQNNITRDVAVMSQLTNNIRLYGTDCNQTEMTIHALQRLKMDKDIKIWLGVWQDNNKTTNARQLSQMWDILDHYGDAPFKGIIVANEILFREQMTVSQLGKLLTDTRSKLSSKGLKLPVATSDLGDEWTSQLGQVSDLVMANIHPFFAGVKAAEAASWTYSFWKEHNGPFFKTDSTKNIIAETGWPSQGGTDCGSDSVTNCPDGSVAGIDEMNRFMGDWVCQAMANGTEYFWFEAFDEPWKLQFDTKGKEWEDHWGLMDINRNLKKGVKIPDCGGKTVS